MMYLSEHLLLQAGGNSASFQFIFFGLMILIFYFFMIRPQAKRQREQRKFISDIDKGDEIVLASGIIGRINKIEEEIVTLDVGNKTFIRVTKSAISKELTDALFTKAAESQD